MLLRSCLEWCFLVQQACHNATTSWFVHDGVGCMDDVLGFFLIQSLSFPTARQVRPVRMNSPSLGNADDLSCITCSYALHLQTNLAIQAEPFPGMCRLMRRLSKAAIPFSYESPALAEPGSRKVKISKHSSPVCY